MSDHTSQELQDAHNRGEQDHASVPVPSFLDLAIGGVVALCTCGIAGLDTGYHAPDDPELREAYDKGWRNVT